MFGRELESSQFGKYLRVGELNKAVSFLSETLSEYQTGCTVTRDHDDSMMQFSEAAPPEG
jgi:hypothetical protein